MKIKEVIVVEGKKDTVKIQQAIQADTIETNGSAIDETTLQLIRHAQEKRGVIIFTDPDYPGQRIRHIINQNIKGCKQAFLPKRKAEPHQKGKSVGIEHASIDSIQEALQHVYEIDQVQKVSDIKKSDLLSLGLIGGAESKLRRQALGEYLHIGYTNGKQLLNRLNMFRITKNELELAMKHIIERGDHRE